MMSCYEGLHPAVQGVKSHLFYIPRTIFNYFQGFDEDLSVPNMVKNINGFEGSII